MPCITCKERKQKEKKKAGGTGLLGHVRGVYAMESKTRLVP